MNLKKISFAGALVLCASLLGELQGAAVAPSTMAPAQEQPAAPCAAPEYHQFDFWVGDWDAFEGDGRAPVARLIVKRILEGCVLLEDYQDKNGHHGESFSIYDAQRRVWHQTWVTNRGELLVIEGGLAAGQMVLSGADPSKGPQGRVRGTWKPVEGGVREIGVTSRDGGKTWDPWFDLTFRPHAR